MPLHRTCARSAEYTYAFSDRRYVYPILSGRQGKATFDRQQPCCGRNAAAPGKPRSRVEYEIRFGALDVNTSDDEVAVANQHIGLPPSIE